MTGQSALTVIADVKTGQTDALLALLETLGSDAAGNEVVPLGRLPDVHFARFVVLDAATDLNGQPLPPKLVYMCDVDGSVDAHLDALVDIAGPGLDRIYQHCVGYPSAGTTRNERLDYLSARRAPAAATYVNTIGRTVRQIRMDARLHDAIGAFLDSEERDWSSCSPNEVRQAIVDFVAKDPSLAWALNPPDAPSLSWRIKDGLHLVGVPLLLLALLPVIVPTLPFYLALLRYHEKNDPTPDNRVDEARILELADLEDHVAQNQFSALGYVKPSLLRRLTAQTILWLASYGTRHIFNRADLTGVKTIHTARWVFIDGKRRLFFASNYDGSLESYMDDFIDKVAWGLNAVFSNGVDYPRTSWLVLDGAKDEQEFKRFIRRHQIPTQVWYTAFPDLTAINIENNARIREVLSGNLDAEALRAWLRRL